MTIQLDLCAFGGKTISVADWTQDFRPWNRVVLDWEIEYSGYARGDENPKGYVHYHVIVELTEALVLVRKPKTYKKIERPGYKLTVTQNIDALHEAAGTRRHIHMHGELERALCASCGASQAWKEDLSIATLCPHCGRTAMRPDVVWFGEMPREMERIYDALGSCDLFISIGTSGTVYPAAGFVLEARAAGAHTVELNLEPSDGADLFVERIEGPATEIVPEFVDRLVTS